MPVLSKISMIHSIEKSDLFEEKASSLLNQAYFAFSFITNVWLEGCRQP